MKSDSSQILKVENLFLAYGSSCVAADVNFTLDSGEFLGIAGESGSGKSTLLKSMIDPIRYNVLMMKGNIQYKKLNLNEITSKQRQAMKGTEIGMILQNPFGAFNPIRTYRKQFAETLKSHFKWQRESSEREILSIFEELGLEDGKRILSSCPYEMSGGMNQRISIALAMLLKPTLLLADEPTSALDVTSESQVIEQFQKLRERHNVAMILVSHNLSVIAKVCDKIAVMYGGRILEYGDTREVLLSPLHPYTKSLIEAIPKRNGSIPKGLEGMPPLCVDFSESCCFAERCPWNTDRCRREGHSLKKISPTHYASCIPEDLS